MALIRRYAEFPRMFTPDEGEIVLVARSLAGPFRRAAVTMVRRASDERLRINFVWLEDVPATPNHEGDKAGSGGHVYISTRDRMPLIRRTPQPRSKMANADPEPSRTPGTA